MSVAVVVQLLLANWVQGIGYVAALFTLASYSSRTMMGVRVLGIGANIAFIVYGAFADVMPPLVLHLVLLPINVARLWQVRRLAQAVRAASQSNDGSLDWLKPFTERHVAAAGETLFARGETAEAMFFVVSGRFHLVEIDKEVGAGEVVGELGFIAPEMKRTLTVVCRERGLLLVIGYDAVRRLHYENPRFSFYVLQLISRRLFADIQRLEAAPARREIAA